MYGQRANGNMTQPTEPTPFSRGDEPQRQPRVASALLQLEQEQALTTQLLEGLEQRLTPALAPARPVGDCAGPDKEATPFVQIEATILDAVRRQAWTNAHLSELLARLEI